MKTIYVSGKYTDTTPEKMMENARLSERYSIKLWLYGYGVVCPHLNTLFDAEARLKGKPLPIPYEQYIDLDLKLVELCDVIFMLPNWKNSKGARLEREHAIKHNKIIVYTLMEAKNLLQK